MSIVPTTCSRVNTSGPGWRAAKGATLCESIIILVALLALAGCDNGPPEFRAIQINGQTFQMELALTPKARMHGLSERKDIADDAGMIFVLPRPEVVNFVMRKCLFPIDIAYLNDQGRIIAMHEMQMQPYDTPERDLKAYPSQGPAQFALEFKGGTIQKLNLKLDQQIDLPLEELKSRAR